MNSRKCILVLTERRAGGRTVATVTQGETYDAILSQVTKHVASDHLIATDVTGGDTVLAEYGYEVARNDHSRAYVLKTEASTN